MEISLTEILAPADILIQLIFLPKLAYFCAVFAYDGIKNGETLTHFGMRKGVIARIYGVFYTFFVVFCIVMFPLFTKRALETDRTIMQQALLFAIPIPSFGFVFIGVATFLFLLREGFVRFSRKMIRNNESARRIYNSMILLPLAMGIQIAIGLPHWVFIGIFAFFIYFSPITSPKEVRKTMSMQEIKKHRNQKASAQV